MHFALALLIALNFWSARDVQVPCHPVAVSNADAMLGKDQWGWPMAMGATSGCRILISSISGAQRQSNGTAMWYCGDLAHEVGHLAGIPHSADDRGLMAADGPDWYSLPYDCIHWRRFARQHHVPIRS